MKSKVFNIDTNVEQPSFSWQPVGLCGSFTKEAILAQAPRASGVYGLFNVGCQIFIGESANVKEALLRHATETDFLSRYLTPTGFAFELCEEGLRKSKAAELIERYCPVLQKSETLSENVSPSNPGDISKTDRGNVTGKTNTEKISTEDYHNSQGINRRSYYKRAQRVMFSALFAASAVTVFCPDVPAFKNIPSQTYKAAIPLTQVSVAKPTSAGAQTEWTLQKSALIKSTNPHPRQNDTPRSEVSATYESSANVTSSALSVDEFKMPTDQEHVSKIINTVKNPEHLSKKWSVQISAAPTRDIAETLIEQLRDSGHDAYVVRAVVKGQTHYRVRVGRFDAKDKAESLRLSLARLGRFQDAYLARD